MSDRSFGDYTNRNVVKNPLLSTAVTGVSIEDLTQNAVLLPAVPSQELISRQDQQHEPQMKTLRHSEHDITNLSSGDTNSNKTAHNTPTNTKIHPVDSKKHSQNEKSNESNIANVSKASVKSDDDFDVNEYFARLQGTRYVSAPLNSTVTDQDPDLQAEENLEEINLNEPDKSQGPAEVQQSLTADIAQNLSQLPNVLPHVASAVFSSFSNMLSLKSRDVTPDEPKTYSEIHNPEAMNTQIAMNVPEVQKKDIAPLPLREPPIANSTSNYRITTKKKVYAQIPGLSSGDHQHIQTINTRPIGQIPPYFMPDANTSSLPQEDNKTENVSTRDNTIPFIEMDPNTESACRLTTGTKSAEIKENIELFNPSSSISKNTEQTFDIQTNAYMAPTRSSSNYIEMKETEEIMSSQASQAHEVAPEYIAPSILHGSTTVIPPPPMFSNLSSGYSQTSVGKTVLPPSVARRLSANQPILKPLSLPTMIPQDNIFIPTIPFKSDLDSDLVSEKTVEQSFTSPQNEYMYSVSHKPIAQQDLTIDERFIQNSVQSQMSPKSHRSQAPFQTPSQSFNLTESSTYNISSTSSLTDNNISNKPLSSCEAPTVKKSVSTELLVSQQTSSLPSNTMISQQTFGSATAMNLKEAASKSNYFQNYSSDHFLSTKNAYEEVSSQQTNVEQPMFFNPITLTQANVKPMVEENRTQHDMFVIDTPSELIKGIREPPKLGSNINYRLSNKKPKYYSGPIDGFGSISNNVKPVLDPVRVSSFQGAFFTPDQNEQARNLSIDSTLPINNENAPPFDLSYHHEYQRSGAIKTEEQNPLVYNDYNTAFDVSRPTTEKFENIQQGSKGFGIIGSLKSKLSSIDINKIQNTVTTFFDPGYNKSKSEGTQKENESYYENLSTGNYQNFPPSASTHLKVFDPIADHEKTTNYYKSQEYLNEAHDYPISQISWDSYYSDQKTYKEDAFYPSLNNLMQTDSTIKNISGKEIISPQDNAVDASEIILKEVDQLPISDMPTIYDSLYQTASVRQETNAQTFLPRQDHYFGTNSCENNVSIDSVIKSQPSQSTADSLFKNLFDYSDQKALQSQSELINSGINEARNTISGSQYLYSTFADTFKSDYNLNQPIAQSILQTKTDKDMTLDINVQCSFESSRHSDMSANVSPKSFFDSKQGSAQVTASENNINEKKSNNKSISGLELVKGITDVTSMPYLDFQLTNPSSKGKSSGDITINKGIHSAFKSEISTSEEPLSKIMLPVLKDFAERIAPTQQSGDENQENAFALSSFNNQVIKDIEDYQESMKFNQSSYTIFDWDQSNLSLISGCPPRNAYKDIQDLEETKEKINSNEKQENILDLDSSLKFFDDIEPIELIDEILDKQASELNICIAPKEFSKPKEKVDDLTSQLIENITAPIQLANPVEYPLVESGDPGTDESEISPITEEISETINLPSPVALSDDGVNISRINYTWSDSEPHGSEFHHDHDYKFQPDHLSLGFFQDKSLLFENIPNNASDEIKAEYKISQEDMSIVPRPLNMSTELSEEDTKSDESGLDVQSIEQDAKKDFPIFDEFLIEPSETDDGKIEYKERERSSDDPVEDDDTFTNRVERYKKMETHHGPESNEAKKDCSSYHLRRSRLRTSPAMTIASYFDTGNYAVENYYRNSLNSPTTLNPYMMSPGMPICIPPGFEEEFKRRLSLVQDLVPALHESNITYIPDTTTQTHTTTTLNLNPQNIIFIPDTSTQTRAITTVIFSPNPLENRNISDAQIITMVNRIVEDHSRSATTERLPAFSNILESKNEATEIKQTVKLPPNQTENKKIEEPKIESLPDPDNFFSSHVENTDNSDAYNNFSRLSSYFTTPPKEEHSKSFFELSQSQDHYRHKNLQHTRDKIQSSVKSFFENSAFSNNRIGMSDPPGTDSNLVKTSTIPENYIENMNLVRDLASYKHFNPNEEIVRTVNYFEIQYGANNTEDIYLGESQVTSNVYEKVGCTEHKVYTKFKNNQLGDVDDSNLAIENIINSCKYCCEISINIVRTDVNSVKFGNSKVRQGMNKSSENKKENISMDPRQDNIGKKAMTVNFCDQLFHDDTNERIVMMAENRTSPEYAPVKHHWFYRVDFEGNSIWRGFSAADSRALEDAFNGPDLDDTTIVATDGGRFDVNVVGRLRNAVYWSDKPSSVMRCSWFYKGATDPRYIPYTEAIAEKLEEEYRHGITTGEWHRRLMLPNNEMVVLHGPSVMVHFLQTSPPDAFTSSPLFAFGKRVYRNPPKISVSEDQPQKIDHLIFMVHGAGEYRHQKQKIQSMMRPRVVRRGCVESEIEDTEPSSIDHLLLMCHGVGSACDMRFRSVEEVVDDFRTTSLQLIQSHYKNSCDNGLVGRVEVLPISWHSSLHSGETGVDTRLAAVTLESIPRLRNFTNDTLLDVLFYTSPVFCQDSGGRCCYNVQRLLSRIPHSAFTLVASYDTSTIIDTVCGELNRIYALFKQRNPHFGGGISLSGHSLGSVILYDLLCHQMPKDILDRRISTEKQYVTGSAGTGQPCVKYPSLDFVPDALYALGSPIAIFECIRGVETLGREFCLPTCKNFFNIFHPYDPIAYRIEPMINPMLRDVKPFLIPHHKGRKRMHLELKDTMARVGADIKQKLLESIKNTWYSMWKTQPPPDTHLEKVVEEEMEKEELSPEHREEQTQEITPEMLGNLNGGRRIDYVLQEAPFEMINEYLFAMSSHVCYWESEDTMLVMLREIYNGIGVTPDSSVPQNTMTVQRGRLPDTTATSSESPSTSRGGS